MNHSDYVDLLRPGNLPPGGTWADFGAGSGAFTFALRELIGAAAQIYALDRDRGSLGRLEQAYRAAFGDISGLHVVSADFSAAVRGLPPLDGILMANSLHFFKAKEDVLSHVRTFLKPAGLLLLVEYNVDTGNPWVPYPLSFKTFQSLALRAGFSEPRLLGLHPSSFLREFYSAMAISSPA